MKKMSKEKGGKTVSRGALSGRRRMISLTGGNMGWYVGNRKGRLGESLAGLSPA